MTKPIRRNTGLWEYLQKYGLTENGSPKEIEAAKKQYRKEQSRKYKQSRRKTHPEVVITMKKATYRRFKLEAHRHHQSIPSFIKEAALHYLEQKYLVPDPGTVSTFAQRLRIATSDIQLIAKHAKKFKAHELYHHYLALMERIQFLETYVEDTLCNPPRL